MTYQITFTCLGLPKMPNQLLGAHWRTRSKHAKKWRGIIWAAVGAQKPALPLKTARVTLTRHSSVQPDDDGLRGSFKSVLDALVHLRVLEDDKPSNIGSPAASWEKCLPKKGRITVTVQEIS